MSQLPLISVIIPVFNASKYLTETIESVLAQTYSEIEIILIDDCSTDNSREIILRYKALDSRIGYLQTSNNTGGPAQPRNIGIANSKGEYIAFLDSDDIWVNTKLEIQLDFLKINKANFLSSDYYLIEDGQKKKLAIPFFIRNLRLLKKNKTIKTLMTDNFIVTSSVLLKKELLENRSFDTDPLLVAVEDLILWLQLFADSKTRYVFFPNKCIGYRLCENSISDRDNVDLIRLRRNYCLSKFVYINGDYKLQKYLYQLNALKYLFLR